MASQRSGNRGRARTGLLVFHLAAIVVAAWLVADTVNAVAAHGLPIPPPPSPSPTPLPQYRGGPLEAWLGPIQKQNVFAHGLQFADENGGDDAARGREMGTCRSPIRVLSTVLVPSAPARSLATIAVIGARPGIAVVQAGDRVGDAATVVRVSHVWGPFDLTPIGLLELVRDDGTHELCRTGAGVMAMENLVSGAKVSRAVDGKFSVARETVEAFARGDALTQMRAVPYYEGGAMKGITVSGIRADSLPAQLGLKNGDRILSINNYELSSPEVGLVLFSRLKNEQEFVVGLQREGRRETQAYSIQ